MSSQLKLDVTLTPEGFIAITDGIIGWNFTGEGIINNFKEVEALRYRIRDLECESNRANPHRFLPALITELEYRATTAAAPRDEAYAMAALLIKKHIGPDKP